MEKVNGFEIIIAEHPRDLGIKIARRLFNYIEENPEGLIALPTGKTPELFIEALKRAKSIPNTKRLRFVQLDEYFPIAPNDPKSFCYYVRENYLSLLNIAPENALTMEGLYSKTEGIEWKSSDLLLLQREATTQVQQIKKAALEKANAFCQEYERKIKEWGGIDFFLGGIGMDGHVAFNQSGSDLNSETRLVDLGGKFAATIGIQTIRRKPGAEAILFAAGDEKASIVKRAVQEPPSTKVPATALSSMKKAQFYMTKAAARKLIKHPPNPITPSEQQFSNALQIAFEPVDFLSFSPLLKKISHSHFVSFDVGEQTNPISPHIHAHEIETAHKDLFTAFRGACLSQNAQQIKYFEEALFIKCGRHLPKTQSEMLAALSGCRENDLLHVTNAPDLRAKIEQVNPDILILPYTYEESAPTDKYRALQITAKALQESRLSSDLTVWEVCPIFYPFGPEDGDHWVDVDREAFKWRYHTATHAPLLIEIDKIYFKKSTLKDFILKAKKLHDGVEYPA